MIFGVEKMAKEALLIIDMQARFDTAYDETTIKNCIRAIKKAIKAKVPIIVLEYNNCGRTLPELTEYLDEYADTFYKIKYTNNGGNEVIQCLEENKLGIKTLKVCGVNINACVAETVIHLVRKAKKKITVIKKACNGNESRKRAFYSQRCTDIFQHKNVTLL